MHQNFNLTGKLLIAMPQMGDPRFIQSVILVCMHDDQGAMGIAINQPFAGLSLDELLKELKFEIDPGAELKKQILLGGPVQISHGSLIHTSEFSEEGTVMVNDTVGFTQSLNAMNILASGKGPKDYLFALGYAGWEAGQLEQELQDNVWLTADADLEILFNTDLDNRWSRALSRQGINPSMLSGEAGHA